MANAVKVNYDKLLSLYSIKDKCPLCDNNLIITNRQIYCNKKNANRLLGNGNEFLIAPLSYPYNKNSFYMYIGNMNFSYYHESKYGIEAIMAYLYINSKQLRFNLTYPITNIFKLEEKIKTYALFI